jgi:hypothetical protein
MWACSPWPKARCTRAFSQTLKIAIPRGYGRRRRRPASRRPRPAPQSRQRAADVLDDGAQHQLASEEVRREPIEVSRSHTHAGSIRRGRRRPPDHRLRPPDEDHDATAKGANSAADMSDVKRCPPSRGPRSDSPSAGRREARAHRIVRAPSARRLAAACVRADPGAGAAPPECAPGSRRYPSADSEPKSAAAYPLHVVGRRVVTADEGSPHDPPHHHARIRDARDPSVAG